MLCIGTGDWDHPYSLFTRRSRRGDAGLIDFDVVDYSNLQRGGGYTAPKTWAVKLSSARDRIKDINPNVHVVLHDAMFRRDNAIENRRKLRHRHRRYG